MVPARVYAVSGIVLSAQLGNVAAQLGNVAKVRLQHCMMHHAFTCHRDPCVEFAPLKCAGGLSCKLVAAARRVVSGIVQDCCNGQWVV